MQAATSASTWNGKAMKVLRAVQTPGMDTLMPFEQSWNRSYDNVSGAFSRQLETAVRSCRYASLVFLRRLVVASYHSVLSEV